MASITRRKLLQLTGSAAAAWSVPRRQSTLSADRVRSPIPAALTPFDYSQVELLAGPLRHQFDTNHDFFFHLDNDRLLKIYRQRAGLPAPGEDMGGWYDDFCPGAHFGQYVSALARFAGSTGSKATAAKVRSLIRGYAETIDPTGRFFLDLRYPGYTYDKLVIALLDAHSLAEDSTALDVLAATTRAAVPHMEERALTPEEKQRRPHKDETYTWDETYTLAENLFLAHERTGDREYFDLGKKYLLDRGFFDPLSEGQNVLPGLHAYSHMNALSSGIQGYLKLGNPKYLRAVTNAVDMILKEQSFATGGWGPDEFFVDPSKGDLGNSLATTHRSFETPCGGYAHFKIMRYLLALTGEARYGDSMERVLYNALLGVKPVLEDGTSFYYSDYHYSATKIYRGAYPGAVYRWDLDPRWPCCSGTFPQVTADYGISSYLRSDDGVYVNFYVPSCLNWRRGSTRCWLLQETNYPSENGVTLTVTTSSPEQFVVYLRIPAWAGKGTAISVNGKRSPLQPVPGSFFPVRREWKRGDRIELEIDQPLHWQAVDAHHSDQVAVLRGPQVLFAVGEVPPQLSRRDLAGMKIEKSSLGDWRVRTATAEIRVRPFGPIEKEIYQTYWKVVG